jgi:hypothetical protein
LYRNIAVIKSETLPCCIYIVYSACSAEPANLANKACANIGNMTLDYYLRKLAEKAGGVPSAGEKTAKEMD